MRTMETVETRHPFTCVTCEIEITGAPTFHVGVPFCCAGCVAGGPCVCSYDPPALEPVSAEIRHCLDVADPVAVPATTWPRDVPGRDVPSRKAPVAAVWTLVGAH